MFSPDAPTPWPETVDRVIEHRLTKAALAILVIISLLPLDQGIEHALRPLFFSVFGAELAFRWYSWRRRHQSQSLMRAAFAMVDGLALLSFLPLELVIGEEQAQLLALFRLTRLLMLLRFAQDLALDIYTILTRREQLQQFALVTGAVLILSFVSAVILSQLSIPHDEDGRASFGEKLWWSFRQMESPDNLVPTLEHNPILIALSLGLTVTGVFIISFIIGIGTTIVDQVVRSERRRPLAYHGHTLVTGAVHASEVLIREFVRIYAKNRQIPSPEKLLTWLRHMSPLASAKGFPRVALLGQRDDPPPYLWEPLMRWVVYREGDAAEPSSLDRVSAPRVKRAILLARDDLLHDADAVTVATLAAFRAMNKEAHTFVEVTDSASVPIVAQVGGPGTVALDVPRLLGMFLCQHLVTPGVERLYRDLLTADGSEIYTHVFVDEDERAALRASAKESHVSFAELARIALARHGVYLFGVFLGDEEVRRGRDRLVPSDELVPWLNPYVLPLDDPRPEALGARPGLVPIEKLRGLVAVAESYLPLAEVARDIAIGAGVAQPANADPAPHEVEAIFRSTDLPPAVPRRVALIGASDALPSLLHELSRYVPGIECTLFVSQRGEQRVPLPRRLENLNVGYDAHEPLPGTSGRAFDLERGGRITIYSHEGPDLAGFAGRVLMKQGPLEAAVFLSEPEGEERDARTALRILRFVKLLEEAKVPHGESLHVLAEFISIDKGAHIQQHVDGRTCGFNHEQDLKLTLVSTGTIKNYFMVHSAFVPGVAGLYEQLLQERGQEIVRLRFRAVPGLASTSIQAIQAALRPLGAIAFAVERRDRELLLAPPPEQRLAADEIVGVYAIADRPRLAQAVAAQRPPSEAEPG
jgi:hypothetical protein